MTGLSTLWLPILVSSVFVFVASNILHMIGWHESDYRAFPEEDKVLDAVRSFNLPPADYIAPRPKGREEMRSKAFDEKMARGPLVVMTVGPGGFSFGKILGQWFLYLIVISIFAAYIAGRALPPGTHYLTVFRFAGATAFIGYSAALWQMSIWYRRSWLTTFKATVDGLIYGLLTAGTFGWLWPR